LPRFFEKSRHGKSRPRESPAAAGKSPAPASAPDHATEASAFDGGRRAAAAEAEARPTAEASSAALVVVVVVVVVVIVDGG
jgi:hypothetical protein